MKVATTSVAFPREMFGPNLWCCQAHSDAEVLGEAHRSQTQSWRDHKTWSTTPHPRMLKLIFPYRGDPVSMFTLVVD
eukprot:2232433-Amphidinium_carterae.1